MPLFRSTLVRQAGKALLLAGLVVPLQTAASQSIATWSTNTTGTLGDATFSIQGGTWSDRFDRDLSTASYSAAPIGLQTIGSFDVLSSWTITFDRPIEDFRMYAALWRGSRWVDAGLNQQTDYAFSESFSIRSGMTEVINVTSNGFSTPGGTNGFHSGILAFSGPITSLTVTIRGQTDQGGLQGVTFTGSAVPVPEPASFGLLSIAGLWILTVARRRHRLVPTAAGTGN